MDGTIEKRGGGPGRGAVFNLLHIPLPWTLGPLTAVMLYNYRSRAAQQWPVYIRNSGLVVLGCMMGVSFTAEAGRQILRQLPFMLVSTLVVISLSLVLGYLVTRRLGLNRATGLMGSIPGGLSQMVALSDEIEDSDVTVVTFMQMIRYLTVVFTVPFLTLHLLPEGSGTAVGGISLMGSQPWGAAVFYPGGAVRGVRGGADRSSHPLPAGADGDIGGPGALRFRHAPAASGPHLCGPALLRGLYRLHYEAFQSAGVEAAAVLLPGVFGQHGAGRAGYGISADPAAAAHAGDHLSLQRPGGSGGDGDHGCGLTCRSFDGDRLPALSGVFYPVPGAAGLEVVVEG